VHEKSRAHSSAGERSLHTGEVQGSIPCAPTRNTIKSIAYATISHRLYPGNLGVQPGHRRPLPLSAIDPRERIRPVQLLLSPVDSKSLARSHLRRVKARPALIPAPAMGQVEDGFGTQCPCLKIPHYCIPSMLARTKNHRPPPLGRALRTSPVT
jgi:hypothetical protein